jgi:hypothetical protein
VVLVHHHRDVRIGFDGGLDQVAQEGFAGVFAGAGEACMITGAPTSLAASMMA